MKRIARLFIILIAFALLATVTGGTSHAQQPTDYPRTVTDGGGNKLTLNAKPIHIVSTTLGTDEILFALVDPARITAITANALDPAQSNILDQAQQIATHISKVDPEQVIALKPDLIFVASYTDPGVVKQLRDAGLPVFLLGNFSTIKDIEGNITLLGQVVGEEAQAAKVVGAMESTLKTIAADVKNVKPLTALYYGPGGYSDGMGSTIDDVITHAGGINALTAAGIKDTYPQISDENLVEKLNPDFILLSGFNSYAPGFVDSFNKNPMFQTLKAVKAKHVVVANDAHIASVSQYIVVGVSDVAALLYPDAYQLPATPNATLIATMSPTMTTP